MTGYERAFGFLRRAWVIACLASVGLLQEPAELDGQQAGPRTLLVSQRQAWMGLTADFVESWSAGGPRGNPVMVVTEVHPAGPAGRAGLQAGDTILRMNGAPAVPEVLERLLSRLEPGNRVSFTYSRGGRVGTISLQAADRPPADRLLTLPPRIQVQVDSIHALFTHYLDSTRRAGGSEPGASGSSRVLLFRIPDGSAESVAAAVRDAFPVTALAFDSLDISIEASASPDADPFEVAVARPSQQVAVSSGQAGRMRRAGPAEPTPRARPPVPPRPPAPDYPRPLAPYIAGQDWVAGARLTSLNPGLAGYFGVQRGLLVVDVATGTPAADAGVTPGDVILQAGEQPVSTLEELRAALSSSRTPGALRLTVVRKGRPFQLFLRR